MSEGIRPSDESSAVISACGKFRYKLSRRTKVAQLSESGKRVVWCMLNPSTADAKTNDRTIEAVLDFSTRWLCTHVDVVNLYAYRATDPSQLWTTFDAIGPENDKWIVDTCADADLVVCAWGGNAQIERAIAVTRLLPDRLHTLVINKDHTPKHPLYIRRDTPLRLYP